MNFFKVDFLIIFFIFVKYFLWKQVNILLVQN